ncbi:Calcium/calmodulin-dependent protein kinase type 1 [Porphyridium purpureum]|uniref:Calcium/calmodulin-dependent protein kinase type 1 n=1 Tax=Porphyridium purpureum TaxID=35688 RepID=A0A5J4YY63_PORPP|nr:Calcium/calmodulin-dependent protein kinase type 1 [Porphyridium purpureum]|eukprot:POR1662..scf209_3
MESGVSLGLGGGAGALSDGESALAAMQELRNGPFPQVSGYVTLWRHKMMGKKKMNRFAVLQGSAFGYAREERSVFEREVTIKRAKPGKHSGEIIIEDVDGHTWTITVLPTAYRQWLNAMLAAQNREPSRFYKTLKIVGSGAFSKVFKVADVSDPTAVFAAKVIRKKQFDMQHIDMFRREVAVQMQARHPHIMRVVDVFENEQELHIIMELMQSDLFEIFSKEITLAESGARQMTFQLLQALAHLHRLRIIHRDVKPENLFATTETWPIDFKLGDFGLSRFHDPDQSAPITAFVGTCYYVAPEVAMQLPYGPAVDVWSAGVILYEALSGIRPFDGGAEESRTLDAVRKAEFDFQGPAWRNVSEDAMGLIRSLLQKDPQKRLTAQAALYHRWFDSFHQVFWNADADRPKSTAMRVRSAFKSAAYAVMAFTRMMVLWRMTEARERMISSPSRAEKGLSTSSKGKIAPRPRSRTGSKTSVAVKGVVGRLSTRLRSFALEEEDTNGSIAVSEFQDEADKPSPRENLSPARPVSKMMHRIGSYSLRNFGSSDMVMDSVRRQSDSDMHMTEEGENAIPFARVGDHEALTKTHANFETTTESLGDRFELITKIPSLSDSSALSGRNAAVERETRPDDSANDGTDSVEEIADWTSVSSDQRVAGSTQKADSKDDILESDHDLLSKKQMSGGEIVGPKARNAALDTDLSSVAAQKSVGTSPSHTQSSAKSVARLDSSSAPYSVSAQRSQPSNLIIEDAFEEALGGEDENDVVMEREWASVSTTEFPVSSRLPTKKKRSFVSKVRSSLGGRSKSSRGEPTTAQVVTDADRGQPRKGSDSKRGSLRASDDLKKRLSFSGMRMRSFGRTFTVLGMGCQGAALVGVAVQFLMSGSLARSRHLVVKVNQQLASRTLAMWLTLEPNLERCYVRACQMQGTCESDT